MLRYQETGEIHKDFHGTMNTTINYIADHYGEEALEKLFKKMGQCVYRSIHEKLKKGDASELVEHLKYFLDRENGEYRLESGEDRIVLEVNCCPAIEHLGKLGLTPSPYFCWQTSKVNAAMCEGSPWHSETEILGCGRCRQTFIKEKKA